MQVGSKIGRLSTKVLTGSKDLFEQVVEAVQTELDSIEGQVRKPRTTKQSLAKRCVLPSGSAVRKSIFVLQPKIGGANTGTVN